MRKNRRRKTPVVAFEMVGTYIPIPYKKETPSRDEMRRPGRELFIVYWQGVPTARNVARLPSMKLTNRSSAFRQTEMSISFPR